MATKAMPGRWGDPWWQVIILVGHDKRVVVGRYRTCGNALFGALRKAYNQEQEPHGATIVITELPPAPKTVSASRWDATLKRRYGATH